MKLKRYWFIFDFHVLESEPGGIRLGYGVTGYDYADAIKLLEQNMFGGMGCPPIERVIEDIDVSLLDPNHVLPNIGITIRRGVWYPALNH